MPCRRLNRQGAGSPCLEPQEFSSSCKGSPADCNVLVVELATLKPICKRDGLNVLHSIPGGNILSFVSSSFGRVAWYFLVFLMLIAAMVAREEYKKSAVSESGLQATIDKIAGAKLEVQAFVDATKGQSVTAMDEGERQSKQAIERRLADATSELKTLKGAAPGNFDMILEPQATIVSEFGRQIKIELLEQEIGFLQRLNRNLDRRDSVISSLKTVDEIIKSTNAKIVDLQTVESGYREKLKNLEDGPMWERYLPDGTDLVAYTNSKLVANLTEQIRLGREPINGIPILA